MIDWLRRRITPPPLPPPPPPAPKPELPAQEVATPPSGYSGQSSFEAAARPPVVLNPPATPQAAVPAFDPASRTPDGGTSGTTTSTERGATYGVPNAVRAVEKAYASGGAEAAAAELHAHAQALGNRKRVDELLAATQSTLDQISTDLANGVRNDSVDQDTNREVLRELDATVNLAGPDGKDAVATSVARKLADAVPAGSTQLRQFDDALGELAEDGVGATLSSAVAEKLINDFGRIDAGNVVLDKSVDAINEVRADYDEKAEALSVAEKRLNAELSQLGPALTPEEIEEFKENFWELEENAEVLAEANEAAEELSKALAASTDPLEQLAAQGDTGATKALFEGYRALAETADSADEAVAFAGRINQDSQLARVLREEYGDAFEQKLADEILAPAVPNAQAEAIAKAGKGGFDAAMEKFSKLIEGLETAKSLQDIPEDFKQMLKDIRKIRAGTFTQDDVQDLLDSWDDKSPLDKSLAIATFGLGLYDLPSQLADGEYLEAIKTTLTTSAAGIELTSGILNALDKTDAATNVAKFGAKFLPLLGLGADAIQAYQDIEALRDGVSAGDVFNLAGTVVSLVGDVAGFVPVAGTTVDVVTTFAGETLRLVGALLNGDLGPAPDELSRPEVRDILDEMFGLSDKQVELLVSNTEKGYGEQMQRLGLEPQQIRELLTQTEPPLFAWSDGLDHYEELSRPHSIFDVVAAFGMSGEAAAEFIQEYSVLEDAFNEAAYNPLVDPEATLAHAIETGDFSAFREEVLKQLPDNIAEELEPFQDAPANTEYFED